MPVLYATILALHIAGAFTSLLALLGALVLLVRGTAPTRRTLAAALSWLVAFEVVTGSLLAILSPEVTALSLCDNFALYAGVSLLCIGALKYGDAIPLRAIRGMHASLASLALFVGVIAAGF